VTRVIDPSDGAALPCCFDDCDREGSDRYMTRTREIVSPPMPAYGVPGHYKNVWYVFCSERHKRMWINSPRDLYNLPSGERGLLAPR